MSTLLFPEEELALVVFRCIGVRIVWVAVALWLADRQSFVKNEKEMKPIKKTKREQRVYPFSHTNHFTVNKTKGKLNAKDHISAIIFKKKIERKDKKYMKIRRMIRNIS